MTFPLTTTLAKVREVSKGFLKSETTPVMTRILSAHYTDDEPLPYEAIIDLFSPELALVCLMETPEHYVYWRKFVLACASYTRRFTDDPRSLNAFEVAKRLGEGKATEEEAAAAYDSAMDAVKAMEPFPRDPSASRPEYHARTFACYSCAKWVIWDFAGFNSEALTKDRQIDTLRTLVTAGVTL